MENLRSISIQGFYATAFRLDEPERKKMRSLVETMTLNDVAIISSPYQSDLFYHSEEDKFDLIIHIWCSMKSINYSERIAKKFNSFHERQEVLEFFFYSLINLTRNRAGFDYYCDHFNRLLRSESHLKILHSIKECNANLLNYLKHKTSLAPMMSQLGETIEKLGENNSASISLSALSRFNPN